MITKQTCPECGSNLSFSYIRPDYDFYINNGKIERDSNKNLWDGIDPYLDFYCSFNREHEIKYNSDDNLNFNLWVEAIEKEFYEKIFPCL